MRRHWRVVGGCALVATIIAYGWLALQQSAFTVTSVFMPEAPTLPTDVGALGASLGLSGALPSASADRSPAFYVDLLRSRSLLGALAAMSIADSNGGRTASRPLAEEFGVRAPTRALLREETIQVLKRHVHSSLVQRTGVVRLSVTAPTSQAAFLINARLLQLVDSFNVVKRQSRASAEVEYVTTLIEQVAPELRAAESRMTEFLVRNHAFSNSPLLTLAYERLDREVSAKRDQLASLVQANARLREDMLRDTPMITVVERPERPAREDNRGLLPLSLLAALEGALLGLLIAFLRGAAAVRHATGARGVADVKPNAT